MKRYNSREIIITHKPTGIEVSCDCEHSQHRNKAKALANLRSKLYAIENISRNDEKVTFSYVIPEEITSFDNLEEFKRRIK